MKFTAAVLSLLVFATVASAQNPDASKWMCRNLTESGGFTYQGETVFGNQACRPVPEASTQAKPAVQPPAQTQAAATVPADAPSTATQEPAAPAEQPAANAPVSDRQQPRVFLQAASHGNTWNARRDQSMEMSKDFEKVCPGARITINQQAADYTVILNHIEVGLFARDNQIQVADKNGDLLKNKEGGSIKGNVKGVCTLILSDWNKQ